MSLFVCQACHAVENTALGRFWTRGVDELFRDDTRALCSECATGKWHGRFPKRTYDGSQKVNWRDGQWQSIPEQIASSGADQ